MEEAKRMNRVKIIAVLVVLAIIVISVLAYSISSMFSGSKVVNKGEGDISVFTDSDIKHIEEGVNSFLKYAYGMSDSDISEVKITIREGSIRLEEYEDGIMARFLVDVSNPRLTYDGSLMIGGSEDEVFLTCPDVSLMQDPNVFCIGHDRESTIDMALGDYLPYETGMEDDGLYMYVWQDYDDDTGTPLLKVVLGACEDGEDGDEAREMLDNWIREKGKVNPRIIPKEISYLECDGDHIKYE